MNKNYLIFDNTLENWGIFFIFFSFALLISPWVTRGLLRFVEYIGKKHIPQSYRAKFESLMHRPLHLFIILLICFISGSFLCFPSILNKQWHGLEIKHILKSIWLTILIVSLAWIGLRIACFIAFVLSKKALKTTSKMDDQMIQFIEDAIRVCIVIIAFLSILKFAFGIDITTLIAGAGIAGLAIALSAKDSLENLLGSIIIFFEKPFVVGDYIRVEKENVEGSVERVGLRCTRIRTPEKTYVTLPNRTTISASIDNQTQRTYRRVRFTIGLTYDTSTTQIQSIIHDIEIYLKTHPKTNQDGIAGFYDFGPSSLDILVQYYIVTLDWGSFVKTKEEINFQIMDIVQQHKADFAFPTQTIHMNTHA